MQLPLSITCVQAEIVPGESEENTRRAQVWLAGCSRIAGQGHVVLFPEYFLQGVTEDAATLAQPADGPFGQAMQAAARQLDAVICAGFLETSPGPSRPYNSIGIWTADGLLGTYHKTHLYDWGEPHPDWKRECRAFLPGDRLGLFEFDGIRVGVMACADGLLPEVPRSLAVAGADLILYPNGRPGVPPEHAELHAQASSIPIAVCNGWGTVGIEDMQGTTRVVDYRGKVLAKCEQGPGAISVTIDIAEGRDFRRTYWPLTARRPELYRWLCDETGPECAPE